MAGSRIQYSTDNAKPAANSGNLLKKPLNGGTPVIASAATQKPTPQRQGVQYATQTRQQARAAAVTQRTCYKEKQALANAWLTM
ncbi:hypothetical protein ECZU34_15050 [Escherichia coli]|nr:hypothetical protein ECZU34_15050 [Escherichia coli]